MAHTMTLKNGENVTIFDEDDFIYLLESNLCPEAAQWMRDYICDTNCLIDSASDEVSEKQEILREILGKADDALTLTLMDKPDIKAIRKIINEIIINAKEAIR